MASSVGGIIEADDYNSIRVKVIEVLGNGNGSFGYGQSARVVSAAVLPGVTITADQWQKLRWDIFNVLVHQTGDNPSIVTVNQNDRITFGTSHPNNAYNTLADSITANRFALGPGQFQIDSLGSKTDTFAWSNETSIEIAYTFNTSDAARYFFNSGGLIRVTSSFSGLNDQQNNAWNSLLASSENRLIRFGAQLPSTGFSPMNGSNFYRLTNTYQTYHSSTSSSPYAANVYRLEARCNVANNSNGSANIVYIRARFTDGYVDPGNWFGAPGAPADNPNTAGIVNGTISVASDMIRPTGVMQTPPGVSTFTVTGPTSSLSSASFIYS
jgi:hypothetical protein